MSVIGKLDDLVVADGHNDLAWQLRVRYRYDLERANLAAGNPELHTDMPRLAEGKVGFQFWSAFVPSHLERDEAVIQTLEQIDCIHRMVEKFPQLELVTSAEEAFSTMRSGKLAGMIGVEGGHSLGGSTGVLRIFRKLGVRYLTLTHNDNTEWAESATGEGPHAGLTTLGINLVQELNDAGIIVDLSHVSERAANLVLDHTTKPPILSHSNCLSLVDHPRNASDDLIQRVASQSGTVMLTFVPAFLNQDVSDYEAELSLIKKDLGFDLEYSDQQMTPEQGQIEALRNWINKNPAPKATISDVVKHINYARDLVGVDHLGIGGDLDGVDSTPVGLEDVSRYPALAEALIQSKWTMADLHKLYYQNSLRVIRDNE